MVPEQFQYLVDDRDKAVAERDTAVLDRNAAVAERDELKARLVKAEETLAWFNRQVFGQRSERYLEPDPAQQELELGLKQEPPPAAESPLPKPAPQQKKRKPTKADALKWSKDVPVEKEVVDVPEDQRFCPRTGAELKVIGEDVVDRLARRQGSNFIKRTVYLKRANPTDSKSGVVRAPNRPGFVEGGKFDESMLAWICVEKFGFYQPLYRIVEKLKLEGVEVSRQTLSKTVMIVADKLSPLVAEMKKQTLANRCLHVDETSVKVQQKGKCRQSWVWIYLAADPNAPPYHFYEFCEDRSQRHARTFLKDYNGTIHADAWSGYVAMDAEGKLKWSACWAHGRRKFENASDGDPKLRDSVLSKMRQLFLVERHVSAMTADERLRIRIDFEAPIVEALFAEVLAYRQKLLPSSALGKACDYLLSHRKNFERYLADPDLRMDNNPAERGLRKLVLGRKNFVFVGSDRGGEAMAGLYSLVQTCRAMEINPLEYLEDVMRRILDHNSQKLHELLPDQWACARAPQG